MLQHLHQLKALCVSNCEEIAEIVEGGQLLHMGQRRLTSLTLQGLLKLTTIFIQQHILTSVPSIRVVDCPELKNLPSLFSGIQTIKGILREVAPEVEEEDNEEALEPELPKEAARELQIASQKKQEAFLSTLEEK